MDILLVDDNPLIQQVMLRYLGGLGYQVGAAGSAAEGLALARAKAPSLMFIDMNLPDSDGPQALQALRALPGCAAVPAIAISGLELEDTQRTLGDGFHEYLAKPIDLDVLEETVRRYIERPSSRSVG